LARRAPDQWGLGLDLPNPFLAFAAARVSEEALRPLAELLLHATLAEHRGVTRTTLRLGASVADKRAFRVEFLPRAHSASEVAEMRTVSGTVRL